MKRQKNFLVLALAFVLLATSFASCKNDKKTQNTDTSTTAGDTTTSASTTTQPADTTTAGDTTTAEPAKTDYEQFVSVMQPFTEATSLDLSLTHNYNYSISGTPYQVNESGNIKYTVKNDKPTSSAVWNVKTNDINETANIYSDDQYIYTNKNNQKTKRAISGDVWNFELELEEASFAELASATADGMITVTGKCAASAIEPLLDALKLASDFDFSEVSDVTFTAVSDKSGAIYKFDYAFTAQVQFSPLLPAVTVTHSGSVTFNSFVSVTITPPADLNTYVLA